MYLENIFLGLQVMLYGLAGVFTVLILFYFLTKLLVHYSIKLSARNADND